MPVRDVEACFPQSPKRLRFLANRGANGIDGVVSSAAGAALAAEHAGLAADRRAGAAARRRRPARRAARRSRPAGRLHQQRRRRRSSTSSPSPSTPTRALYEEHIATPSRRRPGRARARGQGDPHRPRHERGVAPPAVEAVGRPALGPRRRVALGALAARPRPARARRRRRGYFWSWKSCSRRDEAGRRGSRRRVPDGLRCSPPFGSQSKLSITPSGMARGYAFGAM